MENYEHTGSTISYSVAEGEMKKDLVINNWTWNFEPQMLQLLGPQNIAISPALALWVDVSCFNASGQRVEKFFSDMDELEDDSAVSNASFGSDGPHQVIQAKDPGDDAKPIKFKPAIKSMKIAGKSIGMASAAEITFHSGILGGFFELVPYAIRTNISSDLSEVAPVSAAYFAGGNHLRIYIQYPYFDGTLVHDPSIGVCSAAVENPAYMVEVGKTGAQEIQALPPLEVYPTIAASGAAALLAMAGVSPVRRPCQEAPHLCRKVEPPQADESYSAFFGRLLFSRKYSAHFLTSTMAKAAAEVRRTYAQPSAVRGIVLNQPGTA